jgi:hypothetical protein
MKTIIKVSLLILAALCPLTTTASEDPTVADFMRNLAALNQRKCPNLKALLEQSGRDNNIEMIYARRDDYRETCQCIPTRLAGLQSGLSPSELALKLSKSDLPARVKAQVTDKCLAEKARASYANGCEQRYSKLGKNVASYCRCMAEKMSVLLDSEVVQLQHEIADHLPRAAEALKKGQRPPEPPPTLKQFMAGTKSCALD